MTADAAIRPASTSTMNVESKSSFSWSNMLDGNTRVWYRSAGERERHVSGGTEQHFYWLYSTLNFSYFYKYFSYKYFTLNLSYVYVNCCY